MSNANRYSLVRARAGIKPFRLYWFPMLGSTNNHAAKLRREGLLFAPAIVLTGRQTTGRGRGNNSWWSDAGSITATFMLAIHEKLAPQELPLIAGLAVRGSVADLTGNNDIQIKWPNDIYYGGRKLGGLLCERIDGVDLIGVGLNVNTDLSRAPRGLSQLICSLSDIAGDQFDLTDVLIALAKNIRRMTRLRLEQPFSTFAREFHKHDALLGKIVVVNPPGNEPPIRGSCEGIDYMGRLILKTGTKRHKILAGHVVIASESSEGNS